MSAQLQDPEKTVAEAPNVPTDLEDATRTNVEGQDIAIAIVGVHSHAIDPAVEARVVRKIDWYLVPAMILGYGLVYYDKAILGSAVLFGMTTNLHLSQVDTHTKPPTTDTSRLSWATSMFYFGMLAGLYPMTFALQRFRMGRILGGVVCLWALICMLTAAVTSWRGLYAQRFFLGFVESVIPTGFMCIVSSFYTQREQSLRQSWWFSSTGLFTIIGGALNYGFGQINGGDLKRWQYIYLLAGALTFLFGLCCFAVPDSPVSAWFLTKEERVVATERLRFGQTVAGYSIVGTFGAVVSLIITVGMANVAGQTKKCFMAATIFVAYCVGNIVGPQLIKSQTKSRHYPELWLGLIICYCITICASVALYIVLARENKRRSKLELNDVDRSKMAFQDLTDKENPYFQYML
ncbi:putative transporter [Lachnellula hyalina]|uniref:Putative transporter n=1 Tax=Lachnellula hyalina TaxID=1316788 RepID=A0A8H8TVF6_9HELO|nr:putative transporter [Lachnellula hyalina]TVY22195.1 putative transporter [Lachnellula hyalina]